ncbi:MAG TPA: hypothetical protein VGC47_12855 [Acidimicrobiia bacterium]|jgi:hypothetical protein
MTSFRCAAVRIAGPTGVPRLLGRHAATCLACQAEVARNKRVARELSGLRAQIVDPPFDLAARVGEAIGLEPLPWGARQPRVGTAGRIIAASAVGATAGVLAVAALRRRSAA